MAKNNASGTDVVKKEDGALATMDYGSDAGMGFENTSSADYSIPFLGQMQALTPAVVDGLEGARPGVLFNTVTNEFYPKDAPVLFVPVDTKHCYVEWIPREKGGGFAGQHELDSEVAKLALAKADGKFGKLPLPNGNDLVETFYVFGIRVAPDGSPEGMAIAFSSTKIKKYKGWLTKARAIQIALPDGKRITPPLFAHRYAITSVKEKNNKGEFFNFNIGFDGKDAVSCRLAPDSELYKAARELRDMLASGAAKANYESQAAAGREPGSDDGDPDIGAKPGAKGKDAPF